MPASVCVTIVTYNNRQFIERCLRSVFEQNYPPAEVVVVDNASTDGTVDVIRRWRSRIRLILNGDNTGFAAAQNQAIASTGGDWVLVLNPDVVLQPDFIEKLIDGASIDPQVGTICGRLLASDRDFKPTAQRFIDSAGIYFTPAMRHFDRGSHEPDDGRFHEMEYVFGASAAAALYRRDMITDISIASNFFDPDFFAYREDADVAWRAQLLGWRCLYIPSAAAYHVRSVRPGNRRAVSGMINMHSVKNRFLMRVKNITGGVYRRCWIRATARDLMVIGGCLLYEQRSLPAFWHIARCLPRALEARREIMRRRRVSDELLACWFSSEPCAQPVPDVAFRSAAFSLCNR